MASISERDLSVLIPLLAAKIQQIDGEIAAFDADSESLSEAQEDDLADLQETLVQFDQILENLRDGYVAGRGEGSNLPTFEALVAPFGLS